MGARLASRGHAPDAGQGAHRSVRIVPPAMPLSGGAVSGPGGLTAREEPHTLAARLLRNNPPNKPKKRGRSNPGVCLKYVLFLKRIRYTVWTSESRMRSNSAVTSHRPLPANGEQCRSVAMQRRQSRPVVVYVLYALPLPCFVALAQLATQSNRDMTAARIPSPVARPAQKPFLCVFFVRLGLRGAHT